MSANEIHPAEGPRMRVIRSLLVTVGVLTLGWGVFVLFDTVGADRIPGVALWLVAAIILHDAIVSPVVFALGVAIRRAGRRVAGTIVAVIEGTIVVGSIMSLIVILAIAATGHAPDNPTLLPFDYAVRLGVFWGAAALAAALITVWLYLQTRRTNHRSSRCHS